MNNMKNLRFIPKYKYIIITAEAVVFCECAGICYHIRKPPQPYLKKSNFSLR